MNWKLSGIIAFLPHLLAVIVATMSRPGFDHGRQYLSELGERGSSTGAVMNYLGIVPTGVLLTVFGLGMVIHYRSERMAMLAGFLILVHGLCRVTVGIFPSDVGCQPEVPSRSQEIHNAFATIGYVSLTTAVFFAGAWLIAKKHGAMIIVPTYVLGFIASASLLVLITHPGAYAGLLQRIALGTLQIWVTCLALHLIVIDRNHTVGA